MIVDAHEDIAYNAWAMGRDFLLSAYDKRALEAAGGQDRSAEICTVGLPDLQAAAIGLIFASIFTETAQTGRAQHGFVYHTPEEAHAQAMLQLDYYDHLLTNGHLVAIANDSDLDKLLQAREQANSTGLMAPLGLLLEMEGADPVLSPADLEAWWERGVRQIGPAWAFGSRYCGGNMQPGPLTEPGRELLSAMNGWGMILDVSHMAEQSFWQALDAFHGSLVASHSNCRSLVPGERQLSDEMIKAISARNGIIGIVLFNRFLKAGWQPEHGKEAVTLADVVSHIDHICQVTGTSAHVGIGSDLDGGFGREATPAEIDTIADLPRLGHALADAGFSPADVEGIMGGNWLRFLRQALPH